MNTPTANYTGSGITTPAPDSLQRQIKEQLLEKYPSSLINAVRDEVAAPYNRMVSQPEPGVTLVEPISTRIVAAPKPRPFKSGDLVEVKGITGNVFYATYIKGDGRDRSFIRKNGGIVSCYTYQLSHNLDS